MEDVRRRIAWPLALTFAFAVYVGMTVALSGRLHGSSFAAAQAIGAFAVAAILAGRPIAAVRAMDRRARVLACVAGLLGVFGPPAVVAAVRLSDAPAGSVVVFWMAGGWAAIAAVAAAGLALRARTGSRVPLALAGGLAALAGAAGVVSNWERPSSFSPLVRFPVQEIAILAAGALMLAGAYAIMRAARGGRLDGALVCATASAGAAGLVWWIAAGWASGLGSLAEAPVQVVIAAAAWGVVCVALPRVLRVEGPARVGAMIVVAPVLLSTLIWIEQLVGVAGPQPMIASGVVAGVVTVAAASVALWWSGDQQPAVRRWALVAAATVPLLLACVALALPAIDAHAVLDPSVGTFDGSWTLLGWESVAGVSAVALAALLAAQASSRGPLWPAVAGLAACGVWPLTLGTPMHVLTGWLPPGIEQYYGTEYASLDFTQVLAPWMIAAMIACGVGFAVLITADVWRLARPTAVRTGK